MLPRAALPLSRPSESHGGPPTCLPCPCWRPVQLCRCWRAASSSMAVLAASTSAISGRSSAAQDARWPIRGTSTSPCTWIRCVACGSTGNATNTKPGVTGCMGASGAEREAADDGPSHWCSKSKTAYISTRHRHPTLHAASLPLHPRRRHNPSDLSPLLVDANALRLIAFIALRPVCPSFSERLLQACTIRRAGPSLTAGYVQFLRGCYCKTGQYRPQMSTVKVRLWVVKHCRITLCRPQVVIPNLCTRSHRAVFQMLDQTGTSPFLVLNC